MLWTLSLQYYFRSKIFRIPELHFSAVILILICSHRSKLPDDSVQIVSVLSSALNEGVLGAKDANTINEYLCWKAYFR